MPVQPSIADLNALLTKHIADVCSCQYTDNGHNHCAHFVSHVAQYRFGYTCFNQSGKGSRNDRANIRVQEVFAQCPTVGLWSNKPATLLSGLIFVTDASNVNLATKTMSNVPRKHIGFFHGTNVWHYSNSRTQVVTQTDTVFNRHYSGSGITLFYGEYPV